MNREVCVVTGASKGIGRAIAIKMAQEGCDVAIFGRNEKDLADTQIEVEKANVKAYPYIGNVADEAFVKSSIEKIEQECGRIDHLINNAGMGIFKPLIEADFEDLRLQVEANLYGIFHFSKAVLPGMIKNKKGSIINISSLAGKNAIVGGTMYTATKHAVMGFTKSLMLEVREHNIRVAVISPGSVDSNFNSSSLARPKKENILHPSDVAETVAAIIKMPARALISEVDIRPTNPK